jgi:GYF domain 2
MATTLNLATQLASAEFWYVHSEGGTFGPFTPGQMDELGKQERLGPETMVVPAGETNWVPLASYVPAAVTVRTPTSAELAELVGVAPLNSLTPLTPSAPGSSDSRSSDDSPHEATTFESLTRSMPQRSSTETHVGCLVCSSLPIRPFIFKQNTGMGWSRELKTLTGNYCRSCAQAKGRKLQSLTLLVGWWGMISMFVNCGVIFSNAMALWDASRMEEPVGESPRRLKKGLPVIVRPATIGFYAVAGLLYYFKFRTRGEAY